MCEKNMTFDGGISDSDVISHQKVEMAGVEPASENLFTQLSPGADGLLYLPPKTPSVRLLQSAAYYCMTGT